MTEEDAMGKMFDRVRDEWIDGPSELVEWCESPIERVLAMGLELAAVLDRVRIMTMCSGLPEEHEKYLTDHHKGSFTTLIAAQVHIEPYRVDFLVTSKPFPTLAPLRLVIECDGHDFHEKTKEQAARDKGRDREIVAKGFQIMRFTGSEIWRDPLHCARSIYSAVESYEMRVSEDHMSAAARDSVKAYKEPDAGTKVPLWMQMHQAGILPR